ncbi:MAG: enoyl-CoA hydratase/isomerase family protein [Myxococcales bacterium]|nr:enoyl-CoA hydratase/isomerase family protein [Myxococcales bacterium]
MEFRHLRIERDGPVTTVTLDRPDKLNAMTAQMNHEIRQQIAAWNADDAVGAIVWTGAGRGFCSGADLSRFEDAVQGANPDDPPLGAEESWTDMIKASKPVIALTWDDLPAHGPLPPGVTRVQIAVTAEGLAVNGDRRCGLMVGIAHACRAVASTVTFLTSIDRPIAANTLAADCRRRHRFEVILARAVHSAVGTTVWIALLAHIRHAIAARWLTVLCHRRHGFEAGVACTIAGAIRATIALFGAIDHAISACVLEIDRYRGCRFKACIA